MKILKDKYLLAMKINTNLNLALIAMLLVLFSCTTKTSTDLSISSFIPQPVSVKATGDAFKITNSTIIYIQEGLQPTGQYLSNSIKEISGFDLEVKSTVQPQETDIYLALAPGKNDLGKEGYELNINKKTISISATSPAGCFNGVQTLLQTLPIKANTIEKTRSSHRENRRLSRVCFSRCYARCCPSLF